MTPRRRWTVKAWCTGRDAREETRSALTTAMGLQGAGFAALPQRVATGTFAQQRQFHFEANPDERLVMVTKKLEDDEGESGRSPRIAQHPAPARSQKTPSPPCALLAREAPSKRAIIQSWIFTNFGRRTGHAGPDCVPHLQSAISLSTSPTKLSGSTSALNWAREWAQQ